MLPWLLLLMGLTSDPAFPPDDCILLQRAGTVGLRWKSPGRRFQPKYQHHRCEA